MHVQATGTTCNVTVFDINNPTSVILNPTKPCDHSIYNKTCTAFQGALLIDISPALDARTGKLLKQQNPDIQVGALAVRFHVLCSPAGHVTAGACLRGAEMQSAVMCAITRSTLTALCRGRNVIYHQKLMRSTLMRQGVGQHLDEAGDLKLNEWLMLCAGLPDGAGHGRAGVGRHGLHQRPLQQRCSGVAHPLCPASC